MAAVAPEDELERILELKSVREPAARGQVLAAVRAEARDGEEFTRQRLERLIRLDEHFQALLAFDQIEFLRQPATLPEADRDFGLGMQRIFLEAANGYQRFLRNRAAWDAEAADLVVRVIGLALNAVHGFVKWGCYLGEGRPPPWRQIHALYAFADSEARAQVPLLVNPAQPSFRPTVQTLYLRSLILGLLNAGNLSKLQIEIADGWFAAWCADYSLDTEFSPGHHLFYVDTASESGLHLIRGDIAGHSIRFVRADALKAQIDEIQAGLRRGQLFAGHGAGGVFPVEAHVSLLATLERLHQSIQAGSGNGIEERTAFEDHEVDVTLGFDRIVRKIRGLPPEADAGTAPAAPSETAGVIEITPAGLSLSETPIMDHDQAHAADPEVERWRVHDASSRGFGLLVDRGASDTVLLNGLIGLRNNETGAWLVGTVVRKLPGKTRDEVLVGVEVISSRPIAVDLQHANRAETITALYLAGLDTNGKLDAILVRANDFSAEAEYHLEAGGSRYRVSLNRIIRKGADWIKARFEIQAKA